MKLTCSISGIPFAVPQFSWLQNGIQVKHPVFHLPMERLIQQASRWSTGRMTDDECKLLFLAILDNMGEARVDPIGSRGPKQFAKLVQFRSAVDLDIKTVHRNMELLIKQALWKINSIETAFDAARLPLYKAGLPDNYHLDNIGSYLLAWENVHARNMKTAAERYSQRMTMEMRAKQEALSKMIKQNLLRSNNYEKVLGIIALDMMGYKPGMDLYDYWLKLFMLKEPEIYATRLKEGSSSLATDLEELKETCETKLIAFTKEGSTHTKAILVHVRNLLTIHNKGPLAYYDLDDISLANAPIYMQKLKDSAAAAPADKPNPKNYSTIADYMRAKTAWVSKDEIEKMAKARETKLKEQFRQRLIDETQAKEDGLLGEDEDFSQLGYNLGEDDE